MTDQRIAEALTDQRLRACCDAYVQSSTLHRTLAARQFLAMHDAAGRFPRRGPAIVSDEGMVENVRQLEGR